MTATACADSPRLWDSTDPLDHRLAAKACRQCPELAWCTKELATAAAESQQRGGTRLPKGTWAGRLISTMKGPLPKEVADLVAATH